MSVGDSLRRLGQFLDDCERREGARARPSTVTATEGGARADVELALPVAAGDPAGEGSASEPALALGESWLAFDADGGLALTLETGGGVLPAGYGDVEVDLSAVTIDDGRITVTATVSVTSDGRSTTTETGGSSAADVPPFKDAERLAELYAEWDTFDEMAEAIGMDVTGETVRRYMIDSGIHEPSAYDTGSDGEPSSAPSPASTAETSETTETSERARQAATDGGRESACDREPPAEPALPDHVTVDRFVDAVDAAGTIREVGRALDVDRMEAFELLREFDLIEFVMGSLAPDADRDVGRDRIRARIGRAAPVR